MLIDLSRDEIETAIDAIDTRRDSAIDTKADLVSQSARSEQEAYIESLQGILNKLNNAREQE